jgi:hypothetical protein
MIIWYLFSQVSFNAVDIILFSLLSLWAFFHGGLYLVLAVMAGLFVKRSSRQHR